MGLFAIKEGLRIFGDDATASVFVGDVDPRNAPGKEAEIGSMYLHLDGVTYKKTGAANTAWLPYSEIEGGGLLWEAINAATLVEAGRGYVMDAATAYAITFPQYPVIGDRIGFATLANAETNNITINFNGNNFNGVADPLIVDLNFAYFELLYTGNAATGWVLSNSDESGNIANIRTFIGNDTTVDTAVTEYTEENVVQNGDNLMLSIDKLDIEAGDVRAFIGKGTAANDMPTFSGLADGALPAGYTPGYIVDEENLMVSVAKLDNALKDVSGVATAGVKWRPMVKAITADNPTGKTTGVFTDDQGLWDETKWQIGHQVLSTNVATFGAFFEWDGTTWVDTTEVLAAFEAVAVRFDFLDTAAGQQDGAAYMMNEGSTEIIKIADFDLETAASIKLNTPYSPASGDVDGTDSIQEAIQKLDGNNDAQDLVLGTLQGATHLGTLSLAVVADDSTVKNAVEALDNAVADNAAYVGRDVSVDDAMPSFSGLAGNEMPIDYVPSKVTDGDNLTLSVAKLDKAISEATGATAHETTTANVTTATVVSNYPVAGNVGAKFFVFAWDGAGNRYASEVYVLHNGTTVDFTEYGILMVGTPGLLSLSAAINTGNLELTATPEAGTFTVKVQRNLISE